MSLEVCNTIHHKTTSKDDVDICTHTISHTEDPPMYAHHPKFEFVVLNDERKGFWKHAFIELYWGEPRGKLYITTLCTAIKLAG